MELPREEQIRFAKELLPIVDSTSDPVIIEHVHNIAALVLKWSGYEDNGVAFDLSEYTYESAELARGQKDTGWKNEARKSLERQVNEG